MLKVMAGLFIYIYFFRFLFLVIHSSLFFPFFFFFFLCASGAKSKESFQRRGKKREGSGHEDLWRPCQGEQEVDANAEIYGR